MDGWGCGQGQGQNTGCLGQFLPAVGDFEVTLAGADVFVVWSWMISASELELRAGDNKPDHQYISHHNYLQII